MKQRVADEHGIPDDEAHAVARVTRCREHPDRQLAEGELVALGDETVELAAVGRKLLSEPEHLLEGALYGADTAADHDLAAELRLRCCADDK
jgi:hypothetical protein